MPKDCGETLKQKTSTQSAMTGSNNKIWFYEPQNL